MDVLNTARIISDFISVSVIIIYFLIFMMSVWHTFKTHEHREVFIYEPYLLLSSLFMSIGHVLILMTEDSGNEIFCQGSFSVFIIKPLILLTGIGLLSIMVRNRR